MVRFWRAVFATLAVLFGLLVMLNAANGAWEVLVIDLVLFALDVLIFTVLHRKVLRRQALTRANSVS